MADRQVVVEGVGDWVKQQYAEALKPYVKKGEVGAIFYYDSQYGKGKVDSRVYRRYLRLTLSNAEEFESWGAICVDLADGRRDVAHLSPHAVFVVTPDETHCNVAMEWLDDAVNIFIEKPFDASVKQIDRLTKVVCNRKNPPGVWGFDHYLVRAHQFMQSPSFFLKDLGGDIVEFRFHMLEPDDRGMAARAPSLQSGLILDMGSHGPALMMPFGKVNTVALRNVRAAMYAGAERYMQSGRETFAHIEFAFASAFSSNRVNATICVGKCVGQEEEKFVQVTGVNGNRIRLDLVNYFVDFIDAKGSQHAETHLFAKPIHLLIREVIAGRPVKSLFVPEAGRDIIVTLDAWRAPVNRHIQGGKKLPTYQCGEPWSSLVQRLQPL